MDILLLALRGKTAHGGGYGSRSPSLSQAHLAHLFSYDITWGATKKEVERSNIFIEVPRILRRLWLALVISFLMFVMIIVFSTNLVPSRWQIPGAIGPLSSRSRSSLGAILFPIVLNPWLMIFSHCSLLPPHTASQRTGVPLLLTFLI